MTAPTLSSSRLRAMPITLLVDSTAWSKPSICLRRIALISSEERTAINNLLGLQPLAKRFQPTAYAGVDELIAHLRHDAANDFRVHVILDFDASPCAGFQPLSHQLTLSRSQLN